MNMIVKFVNQLKLLKPDIDKLISEGYTQKNIDTIIS